MKINVCKTRDYHKWECVDSLGESYNEITVKLECSICGAECEATGDWDVDDD